MATFCPACKEKGYTVLAFSKGYCTSHQYLKPGYDKRSINQKAVDREKANPSKQVTFKKPTEKKKKPGFFEMPPEEVNSIINYQPAPEEGFDGGLTSYVTLDEIGQFAVPVIDRESEMKIFWWKAASVIARKPYCWECGDFISQADYRAATAHIFPKSLFPSVAANEWNYVVCGARCGCHNKTHRMDTFSQMKIFPVAVQRYLKFGHLITENHKYLDLFLEYANQIT